MTGKPNQLITIVFMGDSITEGQYVDPPHRWVDLVSDRLTRKYLDSATTLNFIVSGVSGETTRQGLERFPASVQVHHPDIVTLQFGLNDCNCWATDFGLPRVSEAAYRANLSEMVTRIKRFGASHIIMANNHPTVRNFELVSGATFEEQRKKYNQIFEDVASTEGVTFCDIESAFDGLTNEALMDQLLPYPDWLHLSHDGHMRYADKILENLEPAILEIAKARGLSATETGETP